MTLARRLAVGVLAVTLAGLPRGASAQNGSNARGEVVDMLVQGLAALVRAPATEPAAYGAVARPCIELYNREIRPVALGPEYFPRVADWERASLGIVKSYRLPLPVCFEPGSVTVAQNHARYILNANARYMASDLARGTGFILQGFPDSAGGDTLIGKMRAGWLQSQSPPPPCRYRVLAGRAAPEEFFRHRMVHYSADPALSGCPPPLPSLRR